MYKQKPGDPLKKLDTPTTFREDSPMMKMAKDGSNPLFKMDSGLYKKPSEVGGTDAQVSGGKNFEVKKGKPVI